MPDATDSLADATPDGAFTAPDAFAAGAHAQSLLPLAVACALVLLTTAAVLRKLYFRAAPGSDADALFAPPTPGADALSAPPGDAADADADEDGASDDDELFAAGITEEALGAFIASKAAAMMERAERGELDIDALGPSGWADMTNVTLVAVLKALVRVGEDAANADDPHGALLAFDEAVELEETARPEGLEAGETIEQVRTCMTSVYLHRSTVHAGLGDAARQKADVVAALELDVFKGGAETG